MESNIIISNLNDFIFCPRSIYYHNLYYDYEDKLYYSTYQINGKNSHKSIDSNNYSTKKSILQGINIYSDELGLIGRIDLYDFEKKELIERKRKIKKIYEGYYLQLYAQYYCLVEMGYEIKKLYFYSLIDNKKIEVKLPTEKDKKRLKEIIKKMKNFNIEDPNFTQNKNKCEMCVYKNLCDYYKNDE